MERVHPEYLTVHVDCRVVEIDDRLHKISEIIASSVIASSFASYFKHRLRQVIVTGFDLFIRHNLEDEFVVELLGAFSRDGSLGTLRSWKSTHFPDKCLIVCPYGRGRGRF